MSWLPCYTPCQLNQLNQSWWVGPRHQLFGFVFNSQSYFNMQTSFRANNPNIFLSILIVCKNQLRILLNTDSEVALDSSWLTSDWPLQLLTCVPHIEQQDPEHLSSPFQACESSVAAASPFLSSGYPKPHSGMGRHVSAPWEGLLKQHPEKKLHYCGFSDKSKKIPHSNQA